jgi:hypothetical protein
MIKARYVGEENPCSSWILRGFESRRGSGFYDKFCSASILLATEADSSLVYLRTAHLRMYMKLIRS